METPVQIVFHDLSHSQPLEALIREQAGKLGAVFPRLTRCHVTIEQPHRHNQKGRTFYIRIVLHVPGGELVVNGGENEDVYAATREAFDAVRRQLEIHAQKRRGDFPRDARTKAAFKLSGEDA